VLSCCLHTETLRRAHTFPGGSGRQHTVTVATAKDQREAIEGHFTVATTDTATITSRQGSVDGTMQKCGLCSLLSNLLRRAMCVGSRRGSGESYYQELAETNVSFKYNHIRYLAIYNGRVFANVA
jgi:hypothetical protein